MNVCPRVIATGIALAPQQQRREVSGIPKVIDNFDGGEPEIKGWSKQGHINEVNAPLI